MSAPPAISVLVRTIGQKAMLKEALDSLCAQTEKDFETVIIEDGPETLSSFLREYVDLSIQYESFGERKGRSAAGNRALALAQGEYCLFLDEDDFLKPEHLSFLLGTARGGGHRIVHSFSEQRAVARDVNGCIVKTGRLKRIRREFFSPLHLVWGNYLPINAVLFARTLYEQAGGFDENLNYLEDWLLWLRYAAIEPEWGCSKTPTAVYHVALNRKSYLARRKTIRQQIEYVRAEMEKIVPTWTFALLRRDIGVSFRFCAFARKVFYHLTSFRI